MAATVADRVAPSHESKLVRSLRARHDVLDRIRTSASARDVTRPLVWLHAPSVGEGLQARPVLEALRAAHADWQLAYTYFSPSAEAFARKLDVDLCEVLPFDGRREARVLLDAWQPNVLAFVKLDVWPVLAESAHARGVRTALVSATLAPNSGRQGAWAGALLRDAYASLDAVGAISRDDAARLVSLGAQADRVQITGDTRMDQVWARAQAVTPTHSVRELLGNQSGAVLVCGSTWPADEAELLPAVREWLVANPSARVIIAPHEPTTDHLAPIERWAEQCALPLTRLSQAEGSLQADWRVLLVDRVGILGELYALGTIAFVGGGFHRAGLHSVLEPAAFGLPVLFGPRHSNAREAGELVTRGGAVEVASALQLRAQLEHFTASEPARAEAGSRAQALVRDGRGSTGRVMDLLAPLVTRADTLG